MMGTLSIERGIEDVVDSVVIFAQLYRIVPVLHVLILTVMCIKIA